MAEVSYVVEQSDETGVAPTSPELGTATGVRVEPTGQSGEVAVSWTKAANASGYIIIAINVNDISGNVVAVPLNDGDLDMWNLGGLTSGETYDVYVAATGSGGYVHALRSGSGNHRLTGSGRNNGMRSTRLLRRCGTFF